jgi:amidase
MLDFLEIHGMLAFPVVGLAPLDSEIEYPTHVGSVAMDGYMDWLRFAFLATTVGMPAISVPIGFTPSGMPVGIQILAPAREEARLLAAARVLEQVTDWRVGPIDPVGA